MKTKISAVVLSAVTALAVLTGCISTVNETKTGGVPFVRDTFTGQYPCPLDQVFQAAKSVVTEMGTLVNEATLYNQSNAVKTVEGRINRSRVWVRVEAVDPKITGVAVQTRTPGGGADIDLAHEVEKEIAVKLVR